MGKRGSNVFILLVGGFLSACSSTPTVAPTVTLDLTAVASSTSAAATQQHEDARSTQAQATVAAEQAAATDLVATEIQGTAEAEAQEATRQAAIVEAKAEATTQAGGLLSDIEQLRSDGYLSSTSGTYSALEDFDQSWAQIGWYQWWYTGFDPTDFVFRADVFMDSNARYADGSSGCALVFREKLTDNHYMVEITMYGAVGINRVYKGNFKTLGGGNYGSSNVRVDELQLMVVVQGDTISVFVNDEHVVSRNDSVLENGNLALSLLSGTNTGFGARCQMTNVELWQLD